MRVQIRFDGANTDQVRKLAVALHHVGHTAELAVGVEGPECWLGETPKLLPDQWARVAAELITVGEAGSVAEVLDEYLKELRS